MIVFVQRKKVIHRKSGSSFRKVIGRVFGGFSRSFWGPRRRPAFFQKGARFLGAGPCAYKVGTLGDRKIVQYGRLIVLKLLLRVGALNVV